MNLWEAEGRDVYILNPWPPMANTALPTVTEGEISLFQNSHQQSHTVLTLSHLASFAQDHIFENCAHCVYQGFVPFLLLSSASLYEYTKMYLSVFLMMDIQVFLVWAAPNKNGYNIMSKSLCGHINAIFKFEKPEQQK